MTKQVVTLNGRSLHEGIRAEISSRITSGVYKPGEAIASAAQLGKEFQVSPLTVKRAVRDLKSAGVLTSIPGKGVFVKNQSRLVRHMDVWTFMDDFRRFGFTPSMKLISITKEKVTDPALRVFDAPDSAQICVRKVLYADGVPIMYDSTYVPTTLAGAIVDEFAENLLVTALRNHNIGLVNMSRVIDSAPASSGAQDVFSIPTGYPMLRQLFRLKTNRPTLTAFGLIESPFDRLACSVADIPAEKLNDGAAAKNPTHRRKNGSPKHE